MRKEVKEPMDLKTVKHLAQLMCQFGLQEVEFSREDSRIRLCRGGVGVSGVAPIEEEIEEREAPVASKKPAPAEEPKPACETIASPLVGTFYLSSAPDQPPFVSEGMFVQAGTVLCIIEAMKVMNEIKAERSGVIQKVLLGNASPVEFGTPMFEILPSGK